MFQVHLGKGNLPCQYTLSGPVTFLVEPGLPLDPHPNTAWVKLAELALRRDQRQTGEKENLDVAEECHVGYEIYGEAEIPLCSSSSIMGRVVHVLQRRKGNKGQSQEATGAPSRPNRDPASDPQAGDKVPGDIVGIAQAEQKPGDLGHPPPHPRLTMIPFSPMLTVSFERLVKGQRSESLATGPRNFQRILFKAPASRPSSAPNLKPLAVPRNTFKEIPVPVSKPSAAPQNPFKAPAPKPCASQHKPSQVSA